MNRYRLKTDWEVVILDMGDDNYILVQKGPEYDVALDLYSEIDVSVVEIPTVISMTQEAFKFVQDTLGRLFAAGMSDRLIQDVRVTAMTFEAQKFWKSYPQNPQALLAATLSAPQISGPAESRAVNLSTNDAKNAKDAKDVKDKDATPFDGWTNYSIVYGANGSYLTEGGKSYILFNTIYNLSIVVDGLKFGVCNNGVEGFLRLFPEFELAAKDVSTQDNLKSVFHRRSFESVSDVKAKYDAFECLYGTPKEKESGLNVVLSMNFEKVRVAKLLSDNYDISDSIDDRIKASELYTDIANMIYPRDFARSNNAAFKKRIAGYLVEHNLKKKRFSDAYYYYGICKKIKEKSTVLSLEEIEALREDEIASFKKIKEKSVVRSHEELQVSREQDAIAYLNP
jgi:hypothetical protein